MASFRVLRVRGAGPAIVLAEYDTEDPAHALVDELAAVGIAATVHVADRPPPSPSGDEGDGGEQT
jgi:hypothetical protein